MVIGGGTGYHIYEKFEIHNLPMKRRKIRIMKKEREDILRKRKEKEKIQQKSIYVDMFTLCE